MMHVEWCSDGAYAFCIDPAVNGLSIEGQNRLVYTRPEAAGERTVTVKVTDGSGQTVSMRIQIGAVTTEEDVPSTGG